MRHLKFLVAMMLFVFAFNSGAAVENKTQQKQKQKNQIVQKVKSVAVPVANRTTATASRNNNDGLTLKLNRVASGKKLVNSSAPKVTGTVASKPVKSINAPLSVTFASKAPTANKGQVSCAYKNGAVSPFSKTGKLTMADKKLQKAPMAFEQRGASGIN